MPYYCPSHGTVEQRSSCLCLRVKTLEAEVALRDEVVRRALSLVEQARPRSLMYEVAPGPLLSLAQAVEEVRQHTTGITGASDG